MNEEKPFSLPFYKKERLTTDCYTFYFQRNGSERTFIPGQYYEMKLSHKNMDERGDSRVFTISSSPTNKEFITITTRIIQSSFKMQLGNLKSGTMVQFDGPWDDLNFDENDTSPHVFIAGGIGITPYHSIISYCLNKGIQTRMTLFASWKNYDEMIFDEFFRSAEEKLPNFLYVPTFTDEDEVSTDIWDGEIGRIDENMVRKYVDNFTEAKYYFSGPPAMIKALQETVLNMGVKKEKIIAEEFEGY